MDKYDEKMKNYWGSIIKDAESLIKSHHDGKYTKKIEVIIRIANVIIKNHNLKDCFPFFVQRNYDFYEHNHSFDEIFMVCMEFLAEYVLYKDRVKFQSNDDLIGVWERFRNDDYNEIYATEEIYKNRIRYIKNWIQIDILNSYFGVKGFQSFLNYEDKVIDSESKLNELENKIKTVHGEAEKDLDEREKKVNTLAEKLEKYETAFNFVGLSQGFENILSKKQKSKKITFWGLLGAASLALLPLIFSFWKFIQGEELSWQKMLPVIGLEFVLIYFFRVVLSHYNSIQTQIMQLELRQSLCEFIQDYAEYAKEMKANDGVSLEKFENLIFSSILSNPDKVPGTFDGVEGLTALVKELRGGK